MSLNELYLGALCAREVADNAAVPSERVDALRKGIDDSLFILDELALLTASLDASLIAVFKRLDLLASDPTIGGRITEEFQDLVALKTKMLNSHFADALVFSRIYEKMVRDKIVRDAGIDPSDEKAAMGYLVKLGNSLVLAESNPSN